jgi:hypothetical protein
MESAGTNDGTDDPTDIGDLFHHDDESSETEFVQWQPQGQSGLSSTIKKVHEKEAAQQIKRDGLKGNDVLASVGMESAGTNDGTDDPTDIGDLFHHDDESSETEFMQLTTSESKAAKKAPAGGDALFKLQKIAAALNDKWHDIKAKFKAKASQLNEVTRGRLSRMANKKLKLEEKVARKQHGYLAAMRRVSMAEAGAAAKIAALNAKMKALKAKMAAANHGKYDPNFNCDLDPAKEGRTDHPVRCDGADTLKKYARQMYGPNQAIKAARAHTRAIRDKMEKVITWYTKHMITMDKAQLADLKKAAVSNKKNEAAFALKKAAAQKHFAAKFKSNKAQHAAVMENLRQSEVANKRRNKLTLAKLKARGTKEKAAKSKAEQDYNLSQNAAQRALETTQFAATERFAKRAAQADRDFEKDMVVAANIKQKALAAARQEKRAKAAAKSKAKAMEKESKAMQKKDKEIKECALDGSECQTPDGKCHKTGKGFFLDTDLVSCTKTKQSAKDDEFSWDGASSVLKGAVPLPKIPKPSPKCIQMQQKCQASGCKRALQGHPFEDLVELGCQGTKGELDTFFSMVSVCPPICVKGIKHQYSWKEDGLVQVEDGCLNRETIALFKMQLDQLPAYKALQFGDKDKAVCAVVKNVAIGLGLMKGREAMDDEAAKTSRLLKDAKTASTAAKRKADAKAAAERENNTCTVRAYYDSHYKGKLEHKDSFCSSQRQDIRYSTYGRRRGYQASSFKLSQGCKKVELWDEDYCQPGNKDNQVMKCVPGKDCSVPTLNDDLNDDVCGISVWSRC